MTEIRIDAAERRAWWPEAFVDEVMPEGRPTPDAWLSRLVGGAHVIEGDEPNGLQPIGLNEGQEVRFTFCDDLGTSRVTICEDGKATWHPTPPRATNHFWCGSDPDTICDTPESYAERQREYGDEQEICCLSYWGDSHVRCRFTAQAGPPRFLVLDCRPGAPIAAVEAPALAQAHGDLLSRGEGVHA